MATVCSLVPEMAPVPCPCEPGSRTPTFSSLPEMASIPCPCEPGSRTPTFNSLLRESSYTSHILSSVSKIHEVLGRALLHDLYSCLSIKHPFQAVHVLREVSLSISHTFLFLASKLLSGSSLLQSGISLNYWFSPLLYVEQFISVNFDQSSQDWVKVTPSK